MNSKHRKEMAIAGSLAMLFCIAGTGLTVLGFHNHAEVREFVAGAESAEGRVVGFEESESGGGFNDRENILYAVVCFDTGDGREVRFRGPSQDGLEKYDAGDEVQVLYHPTDPEGARIDSFMGLWFGATMLWVVGGGAILIPLWTMWEGWKWVKRQEGGR